VRYSSFFVKPASTRQTHFGAGLSRITKSAHFPKEKALNPAPVHKNAVYTGHRGLRMGGKPLNLQYSYLPRRSDMDKPPFFEDLQSKINKAIENSPAKDIEKNVKAMLSQGFAKLDLVTREEFDVQAQVLAKTRAWRRWKRVLPSLKLSKNRLHDPGPTLFFFPPPSLLCSDKLPGALR
jgi:hypothetical protein